MPKTDILEPPGLESHLCCPVAPLPLVEGPPASLCLCVSYTHTHSPPPAMPLQGLLPFPGATLAQRRTLTCSPG